MTCPNCGQEFEGKRCPNCGRSAHHTQNRIGAIAILIVFFAPLAAVGTCSSIAGTNMMTAGGDSEGKVFGGMAITVGIVAFLVAVAMVMWAVREWKG